MYKNGLAFTQQSTRMYHIVAINENTGNKTYMTAYPMTHAECCINLTKITKHSFRRIQLEQVKE